MDGLKEEGSRQSEKAQSAPVFFKKKGCRQEDGVNPHPHGHRFLPAAATALSISPPSPLRCACSAACMRERGDEEGEGRARAGLLRRRRPPPQPPSASSPPSSPSPLAMEGAQDKKGDITKAIRDRLSFSSAGARLFCWGNTGTTRHPIRRSRSRSGSGKAGGEHGTPVAVLAAKTSSCACIGSTRNGKAVAAGVRSLVERNDFYCQECNTHK